MKIICGSLRTSLAMLISNMVRSLVLISQLSMDFRQLQKIIIFFLSMKKHGFALLDLSPGKCNCPLPLEFLCLNIWPLKRGPSRPNCFGVRQWEASRSNLVINSERKIPEPGGSLCSSGVGEAIKEMTI